ncbi:MAG: phosphoribosyltransferase [Anaerolineae bacterium]
MNVLRTIPHMPTSWVYETRSDAGRELARELAAPLAGERSTVLAIPRGGVPVGAPIALALDAPLDVTVPRKLPIPWEPEAGFGAVTPEGTVVLNEEMRPYLGLADEDIRAIAREVQQETQRRLQVYRGDRPPPPVRDRTVILTDDGLATGLTMIAAIRAVRSAQPRRVLVAVPAAPRSSLQRVAAEADDVYCLIEQVAGPFAVASFYHYFPDLSDEEVVRELQEAAASVSPQGK